MTRRLEKICTNPACGKTYSVEPNNYTRSKRCPACQASFTLENIRTAAREKARATRAAEKQAAEPYQAECENGATTAVDNRHPEPTGLSVNREPVPYLRWNNTYGVEPCGCVLRN